MINHGDDNGGDDIILLTRNEHVYVCVHACNKDRL